VAAPRLLPDKATLARERRQGDTYATIAERYGVSEAAVYQALRNHGLVKEARADHSALIPWTVKADHQHTHPALMLRTLSRRRQGLENPAKRDAMLDRWLDGLEANKVVVCYDPAMGPNPASPHKGGFFYMARKRSDGDNLIRHTKPGKGLPLVPR
jgi:transposase-like protein